MPLSFLAKGDSEDFNKVSADCFLEWEYCSNSSTPWEVTNAVEGIFEEESLVKSLANFRALMTVDHQSLNDAFRHFLVPRLMALVQRHKHLDMQLEATQTILHLAKIWGSVFYGVCAYSRVFVDLLSHTNANLREHAIHTVGFMPRKQMLVGHGAINILLRLACSAHSARELEIAVQTLSLFPWDGRSDFSFIASLAIFLQSRNPTVIHYAAKMVVSIMSPPSKTVDAVLQAGVLPPTAELLRRTPTRNMLFSDALKIVRKISCGSEQQHLRALIDHDLLRLLRSALKSGADSTIVCQMLANICAGSQNQVQQVIEAGVFEDLVEILRSDGLCSAKREAARAISNATIHASSEQMQLFVDMGCVQELVQCMIDPNFITDVASPALHALHKFLKFGATQSGSGQQNAIARMVKEALGGDFEEWRKRATNKRVHDLVVGVMELCGFEGLQ